MTGPIPLGEVRVLTGGFTVERMGGGLWHMTRTDDSGVRAEFISCAEIQQILDDNPGPVAD